MIEKRKYQDMPDDVDESTKLFLAALGSTDVQAKGKQPSQAAKRVPEVVTFQETSLSSSLSTIGTDRRKFMVCTNLLALCV